MERRPESTVAREQFLRVAEAKYYLLCPSVPPVTLEHRCLRMVNPSNPNTSGPTQQTTTAITTQISSTTTTTIPSLPTSTTTAATSVAAPASPQVSATTAPPLAPAAAPSLLAPASIVGGKRPLGEESPIIILTEHKDDEPKEQSGSDLPESDHSSTRKQQTHEQIGPQAQKPEESTRKLSTGESTKERGRGLDRQGVKPGVQFSDTSPKRDVSDVMQFFQEQEKSLQESFLSLPQKSQKKQRSPSPKMHPAAGLEHLDNLIRLMEQLTSLKDENSRLRKRCDYLESTKVLLQTKRELSFESSSSSSGFMTLPAKHKHHHHHHHHHHKKDHHPSGDDPTRLRAGGSRLTRPRISSAEELEYFQLIDTSSDQRPKRAKSAMHKRSFSTGSLEVPSELISDVGGVETRKRIKSKTGRSIFSKSSSSKQKSKSSKWARVKKVLTGQKLYEDLGTTIRTIRDLGKSSSSSSHVRYSTSGVSSGSPQDLSPPSSRVSSGEHRSPELLTSGVHTAYESRAPLAHASPAEADGAGSSCHEETDADLTSEIWMGPPDWWEEYEARKEEEASTNSDVSSVIEVTTMYLGKKEGMTSSVTSTSATTSTTGAPLTAQEKFLMVEKNLPRRQSSPSLISKEEAEEDDLLEELASSVEVPRILHKSSSCKSADLELPKSSEFSPNTNEGRQSKKTHRTAWGRVKDIIHTRKDSIKKRPKREKSGVDSEETSEIDMEALLEEQWPSESFAEGLLSRSTPKSSPMIIRQQSSKTTGDSPPRSGSGVLPKASPSRASFMPGSSPGNVDVAALLAGSMSDEFSKKMQEWEQKKSKKSPSYRASIDDGDIGSADVSSTSQDFPVRTIDLRDYKGRVPDGASDGVTPEESNTSMEVLGAPSINVEEIQKRMTDSFSRKMQEWERLKYKGGSVSMRDTSPIMERKESKGRKDERQKSKRSREEKEKEKWERQREREMQKVEREQIKLEKEKLRIEKERLRALEREAKLEKLKGRLSQTEADPGFKNPVLSPLAEYKVTADFARKLHEWELRKGLSHDVSNSIYLEAQKMSMQHLRTGSLSQRGEVSYPLQEGEANAGAKASPPPPLSLQPYWDSPEESSPIEKYSEESLDEGEGDDETSTSVTEECLTKSNIASEEDACTCPTLANQRTSLERANTQLLENLQKKELEYAAVQDEVVKVNEKLAKVREEHATEMARFHRDLAKGTFAGPVKLEVGELETTMGDLEEKIKLMENFGEKLAMSMESAAVGKWQSIEGEETVHTQLVELVDQMRNMLVQATQSEEQSQKTMALTNFETLYSQAMKLQVQMNNLRLSHLERNREIMVIKRQLLLQEVNNLLLQADITRRETELYQFHEAKRFASLKRWNTFSGCERQRPQVQVEIPTAARAVQQKELKFKQPEAPRVNIPFIPEEILLASAASSSLSAPASPSAIAAASGTLTVHSPSSAGQPHSSPGAAREQSTDRMETVLLTPSLARRDRNSLSAPRSPSSQHRSTQEARKTGSKESSTTLQPPKAVINLPTRKATQDQKLQPPSPTTTPRTATVKEVETSAAEQRPKTSSSSSTALKENNGKKPSSASTEITTICDSAPLHKEIEELKRVKSKVEKGSPTLKRVEGQGPYPAPSPGKGPRQRNTTEAPDQSIPRQQNLGKSKLTTAAKIIDDDYSPAPSVMECTETPHVVEQTQLTTDSELGAAGGLSLLPPAADTARRELPPTSDQSKAGSKSPRSPASKHKLLRRQKEERDTKLKDYRAISPKGSPIAARGKPPLPRQATPVQRSPSASPAAEKGPRSKSVGDMDPGIPDSPTTKPIQDAINRFEKRATVCETEDRPIELRKTPSPTLHLPRVGLVSRVRRLKPAAELLEESQRFRSGHSIYATRIMQRYILKDEQKPEVAKTANNKENLSGTYVHAIVRRLSRETTPVRSAGSSRTNSDLSLKRTDSPRAQSEFVTHIVRKLSSSSGPEAQKSAAPFKDLTNDGQVKKMAQTFNGHPVSGSPERTLSDSDIDKHLDTSSTSAAKTQHRKSCEVAMVLSSTGSPTSEESFQIVSMTEGSGSKKPDSTIGSANHQSLPALGQPSTSGGTSPVIEPGRVRAATYCVSEGESRQMHGHDEGKPPLSPTLPTQHEDSGKTASRSKGKAGKSSHEKKGESGRFRLPSSLSPERRGAGRGKGGTVGVLCKQSISFDLGVTLYSDPSKPGETNPKARQARSWDPSETVKAEAAAAAAAAAEVGTPSSSRSSAPATVSVPTTSGATASGDARPVSSSSEGEVAPSSPTTQEKKKSRRFLDSSWLQKSKKFFKVSK